MNLNKKKIIALLVILSFVLLIVSSIFVFSKFRELKQIDPLELEIMSKEEIIQQIYIEQSGKGMHFYYFIPVFGFFGIVVGALVYYILTSNLQKKDDIIKNKAEIILKLLNPDERKVIKKIADSNGRLYQSEITYLDGFNKVKSHRIVESLVQKGILQKEIHGKARFILMDKELLELLK